MKPDEQKYRAIRPIAALKSLYLAWRGRGPMLYRLPYVTNNASRGVLVWIQHGGSAEVISNNHDLYINPDTKFVEVATYKTKVNGEKMPVKEIVDRELAENPDEYEAVELPDKLLDRTIHPVSAPSNYSSRV